MKVNPIPPVSDPSVTMRQPVPTPEPLVAFETTDASTSASTAPAGYISPLVSYDQVAQMVVIQIRDAASGEVTRQIPTQEAVDRYRDQATGRAAPTEAPPELAPTSTQATVTATQMAYQSTVATSPDAVTMTQPDAGRSDPGTAREPLVLGEAD